MSSPTVEILGAERRRRFTAEDRARIVAETYAPGMTVSQVARLNGIGRDLLFHWRRDARDRAAGTALLPVEVRQQPAMAARTNGSGASAGSIAIEFKSGDRVRIEGGVAADVVRELVKALKR
jgi:transposase